MKRSRLASVPGSALLLLALLALAGCGGGAGGAISSLL